MHHPAFRRHARRFITSALTLFLTVGSQAAGLNDCRASFDGKELVIANRHVERKWLVSGGLLYATSFKDLDTGRQWLARPSAQPAPFTVMPPPDGQREMKLSTRRGKAVPVEAESLVAELTASGPVRLSYRFQVFPDSRGISIQLLESGLAGASTQSVRSGVAPEATGIEQDRPALGAKGKAIADVLEDFHPAPQHLRLTAVRLLDQTDVHNELAFENEWLLHTAERVRQPGNLFFLEETLSGDGLIFLKEAPLPHARPVKNNDDFMYDPGQKRCLLLGNGIEQEGGSGYRYVTLAYTGGRAGRIEALQQYQRQLRAYNPARDAMFVANTWGDRSRDSRITEEFMLREVEAGAKLGVDVIQIDDGWMRGRTSNSARGGGVWTGFWAADPRFWDVDETRFPRGLRPVIQAAAFKGLKFGLWFGPDSSNDFANWERDAAKIVELHRTLGVNYIKIDGVKAVSKAGERNLRAFFDRVLEESKGAVTFDLDVTAETRPGYYGMVNVGPLFVENRYTDWHRYWPHQTLRNLWKLAQYVDPLRLRVEFLNNTRNTASYPEDPLAPAAYSPVYLFATTMFSNPLGWFEVSNLPANYFAELPALVSKWKKERAALFAGTILPIGDAPDGTSWTGFLSLSADRRSGYALIFREKHPESQRQIEVPQLAAGKYATTVLHGSGAASLSGGKLLASIPDELRFLWVRFERAE